MRDMILNTNILPEPLFAMIHTEKIRVHETNGELRITPIPQTKPFGFSDKISRCSTRHDASGIQGTASK
jgi:hypothetical protein